MHTTKDNEAADNEQQAGTTAKCRQMTVDRRAPAGRSCLPLQRLRAITARSRPAAIRRESSQLGAEKRVGAQAASAEMPTRPDTRWPACVHFGVARRDEPHDLYVSVSFTYTDACHYALLVMCALQARPVSEEQ